MYSLKKALFEKFLDKEDFILLIQKINYSQILRFFFTIRITDKPY